MNVGHPGKFINRESGPDDISNGKLAFFVTHRLSIIRYATQIFVMDKGRIIDDGNHSDLMKRCAVYRRMYSAQADKYIR